MKRIRLHGTASALSIAIFALAFAVYGSSTVDYSTSFVQFTINSLNMRWEKNPGCFAVVNKAAGGYALDIRASDKATNDAVRILVALEGDGPWEGLYNSSETTVFFAGKVYKGFVILFLDTLSANDEKVTGRFEPYTLTWASAETTITVGEGTFQCVRVK
jgi:hypothetical protein